MFDTAYVGGATSKSVYFRADTISTGLPDTSIAYNTGSFTAQYIRNGAAAVSITLATQTAAGAYSSGGFVHIGMGKYRLDVPNAALVAGVDNVIFALNGPSTVAWSECKVEITGSDPRAAVSSDVNVVSIAAGAITAASIASDAFTAAKFASDVTTELQAGLATAASITTLSGKIDTIDDFLDTEVAAIKSQTDQLVFTSGALNSNVTAMAANVLTATALNADAVAEIQSGLPMASTVASIKSKTDGITFSGAYIQADTKQINTTDVSGTGVTLDPWIGVP